MIKKTENCLYCGAKMESKTAKKKFCCDLHRVYFNREQKAKKKGLYFESDLHTLNISGKTIDGFLVPTPRCEITTYPADPGAEKQTGGLYTINTKELDRIFDTSEVSELLRPLKPGEESISASHYNLKIPKPTEANDVPATTGKTITVNVNTTIPSRPEKMIGEHAIDFAARVNEWKLKYNQQ